MLKFIIIFNLYIGIVEFLRFSLDVDLGVKAVLDEFDKLAIYDLLITSTFFATIKTE